MSENSLRHATKAATVMFGRQTAPTDTFFSIGWDSVATMEPQHRPGGEIDGDLMLDSRDFGALATTVPARAGSR